MPLIRETLQGKQTQMADVKSENLAAQFCVDDLPSASQVGTRLHNILRKLEAGENLSSTSLAFLQAHY
jgi:hypothetical protein